MARASLPTFDGPYPQYYSIVTLSDDTVLGQIRSVNPSDSIEVTKAGRVGSSTKKALRKTKETAVAWALWVDHADLDEFARILGATSTPSSSDTIKLDPTVAAQTFKIKNYDSEESTATLLSTIYLYNHTPKELSFTLDEDGEQVAEINGDLEDLYWIVA